MTAQSSFDDARLTNKRHPVELLQQFVEFLPSLWGQLWRLEMPDRRLGYSRTSLCVDVEGSDGELGQRLRQVTELEDDAAHVQRTFNEVLVTHGADVQTTSTQVQVAGRCPCKQQHTKCQAIVQTHSGDSPV